MRSEEHRIMLTELVGLRITAQPKVEQAKALQITEPVKARVVDLACCKPKEFGLAAELWMISALIEYVVAQAGDDDFAHLSQEGKASLRRILNVYALKSNRVRYFLARRDAQFERKKAEGLLGYCNVNLYCAIEVLDVRPEPINTVSVDEKPGGQTLSTTGANFPLVSGNHAGLGPDHEYVRIGTLSIIALLNLHTGEIIANVELQHRCVEFVALRRRLHQHSSGEARIRVVLDNYSAYISKEPMVDLASRSGRFECVHTSKHGSWLNLLESSFSRMARSFLRHTRVASLDEPRELIRTSINKTNTYPMCFQWKNIDFQMT